MNMTSQTKNLFTWVEIYVEDMSIRISAKFAGHEYL